MNKKRERFVNEYLIDYNATQAAIRAGYSDKTAYSQGQRLLKKVEVKAAIEEGMKKIGKKIEITQERIAEEIAKIAFSNMHDFAEYGTREVTIGVDDKGQPIREKRNIILLKESAETDGTLVSEVKNTQTGVAIKLHDKIKALELIGRFKAMFTDKNIVEIPEELRKAKEILDKYQNMTDEELESIENKD
jgi:phage terminase small subunit